MSIQMQGLQLVLVVLLMGCICNPLDTPENETINTTTTTTIKKAAPNIQAEILKLQNKKCPSCPACSDTAIRIKTVFQNVSMNISVMQEHELMNIRPKNCFTASCSAGCYECKYQAMDIFGLAQPKYSERESSKHDPFREETHVVPVYNDGFSDYFEIPADVWYFITNDSNGKIKFRKRDRESNQTNG